MRGKRVGGSTVGSLDYGWLKEVFPKFGLQIEKDVDFVPVRSTSSRYTALRAGSIDAASLSPPSSLLAQAAGYPSLFRFADYLEDIQASIGGGGDYEGGQHFVEIAAKDHDGRAVLRHPVLAIFNRFFQLFEARRQVFVRRQNQIRGVVLKCFRIICEFHIARPPVSRIDRLRLRSGVILLASTSLQ